MLDNVIMLYIVQNLYFDARYIDDCRRPWKNHNNFDLMTVDPGEKGELRSNFIRPVSLSGRRTML